MPKMFRLFRLFWAYVLGIMQVSPDPCTKELDSVIDSEASVASALPLILHEFPVFTGFSTIDPSLSLTSVKATDSNDMMPIIKEELKNRIQFRRMAEGNEELMVEFTEKPKAELTAEEKEKVERRRKQNRMAARRFREKQNTIETKLQKESQKIESDNTSLRYQIRELRRELEILQSKVQEHLSVCPYVNDPYMQYAAELPVVTYAYADLMGCDDP